MDSSGTPRPVSPPAGTPPAGPGGPSVPPPQPTTDHHGSDRFFDSLRRTGIARTPDRWVGGVAAGLAHRLGVDPLVVRGALVVLTLFGGLPLLLYGLAWALLPESTDGRIHLQEAIRGRFDAALAGAAALVVLGITRPVLWVDPGRWAPGWVIVVAWLGLLATVGVVALLVAGSTDRRPQAPPTSPAPPPGTAPFAPAPGANEDGHGGAAPVPAGGHPVSTVPAGHPAPESRPTNAQHPAQYPAPPPSPSRTEAGGYPGGPAGPGQVPGPGGWQQPPPPPPGRPRAPGPGSVAVAVVLGLCLLAGAGILLADRAGLVGGSAALTVAGVALGILGLGVLVSGARGRRSGVLGGLAIALAVLAVPAAVVADVLPPAHRVLVSGDGAVVGDATWRPTTASEAAEGFSLGIGSAQVDLTDVPLDLAPDEPSGAPVQVPVDVAVGSTTVVVPSGVPVRVTAHMGAGEIRSLLIGDWLRGAAAEAGASATDEGAVIDPDDGSARRVSRTELRGTDLDLVLRSPTPGDVLLVVRVDAGLGDITIQEEQR